MTLISLSIWDYLIVLPLIFLAGLIDSVAGGGGLISLPAYWGIGLPAHLALGTNKFSSCLGTSFSTLRYFKAGLIDLPVALLSAACALIGSHLGAKTVLYVSNDFLNYLLIILIPLIAFITLFNKKLGLEDNSQQLKTAYKLLWAALAGGIIGFYDGFFGPGTGTFLILIFAYFLRYSFDRANAITKVVNLASNIAALITFALAGKVFYPVAIPAACCGIAGNLIGARLVIQKGNLFIRRIFILALALLMLRIIWNLFF